MALSKSLKALLDKAKQTDAYWVEKAKLNFAIALERWRVRSGLTNKQLAEKIGSSPAYMTKVFRGDTNFTIETMVKLARACDGQLDIRIVESKADATRWAGVGRNVVPLHQPSGEQRWQTLPINATTALVKNGSANHHWFELAA